MAEHAQSEDSFPDVLASNGQHRNIVFRSGVSTSLLPALSARTSFFGQGASGGFCIAACSRSPTSLAGARKLGGGQPLSFCRPFAPPTDKDTAESLSQMLGLLHEKPAKWLNQVDSAGNKIWHNYHETRQTYEKSYLAWLNWTHQSPMKHGLAPVAKQYPWSSARWVERTTPSKQIKTLYRFKTELGKVPDDFEASTDW